MKKLLIITQVVDTQDPILGFFVRWIEEFAKHVTHIEVICLRKGEYTLPKNVRVHSLGKEQQVSRIRYLFNFYRYIWKLRHEYDAVFVHMNPEYVVLGGLWWRLWHKRIALWYTHKNVDIKLRVATLLVHKIFTASKESFRINSRKVRVVGHGIDTEFFSPSTTIARGEHMLSVGRLMQSKRHDLSIRATALAGRELLLVGDGPERKNLELLVYSLGAKVQFLGGMTQEQLRDIYRGAAALIHTSETGSLDKVVLEALATDTPVITTSRVFEAFPVQIVPPTPGGILSALNNIRIVSGQADIIRTQHSLQELVPTIVMSMKSV